MRERAVESCRERGSAAGSCLDVEEVIGAAKAVRNKPAKYGEISSVAVRADIVDREPRIAVRVRAELPPRSWFRVINP